MVAHAWAMALRGEGTDLKVTEIDVAAPHMHVRLVSGRFGKSMICPGPSQSPEERGRRERRLAEHVVRVEKAAFDFRTTALDCFIDTLTEDKLVTHFAHRLSDRCAHHRFTKPLYRPV